MIHRIERLIEEKRATYFSMGLSSTAHSRYFCTIWAKPASDTLACGHGDTFDAAIRDALSQLPDAPREPVVELPGMLPGLVTR